MSYHVDPSKDGFTLLWKPKGHDDQQDRFHLMDKWTRKCLAPWDKCTFTNGTVLQTVRTSRRLFDGLANNPKFTELWKQSLAHGLTPAQPDNPIVWVPGIADMLTLVWEPSSEQARQKTRQELMPAWQKLVTLSISYDCGNAIVLLLDVTPDVLLTIRLNKKHKALMTRSIQAGLLVNPDFFIQASK